MSTTLRHPGPHPVLLRARLAVRQGRQVVRDRRAVPGWDEPLAPVVVAGAVVQLRPPRTSDARAWCALRLAGRAQLEPWWPTHGTWLHEQTPLAWTEHCVRVLAAARRGAAHPYVVLVDGELRGEVGIDAVDLGTGTGEFTLWIGEDGAPSATEVTTAALALVCLRAMDTPHPLQRLVVPVDVANPAPVPALSALGFRREVTLRSYRRTSSGRTDHDLYALHRDDDVLDGLRRRVASLGQEPTPVAAPVRQHEGTA